MNVLLFNGSPRKRGNTETLLNAVAEGVRQAGGSVEIIRLCDLEIKPCISCGGCDKTGKCVQKDDMIALYDKIDAVRRMVIGSPIYFYGVTAQTKAFIDRTQALWCRKYLLKEKGGWPAGADRKGFFVSVAATKGSKIFEGAVLTAKYTYDAVDMDYGGELLVKGVDKRGEMSQALDDLQKAEAFGRSLLD